MNGIVRGSGFGRYAPSWLRRFIDARRNAASGSKVDPVRANISRMYVKGTGIEIGALGTPLPTFPWVKVTYVDSFTTDELRRQYPELANEQLVDVTVIDNGEELTTFAANSQHFIIANHMLEHTQDPIATLKNHFRILKPGGHLFAAVPDKRRTFDIYRPETTLEHHIKDHREGPAWSRTEHFREFYAIVGGYSGSQLDEMVASAVADPRAHVHFHVWSMGSWLEFLNYIRTEVGFEIELVLQNGIEIINVLRKPE